MTTTLTCGAVFPAKPGQAPCRKRRGHEDGPDTDWKRDYHSNGLLKWRVDGLDLPPKTETTPKEAPMPTATTPGARIFRYEVPVDDQWHDIDLCGDILHVDTRGMDVVEFWALHQGGARRPRRLRVFGTGHPLPPGVTHVGTAVVSGGALVWHLVEIPIGDPR